MRESSNPIATPPVGSVPVLLSRWSPEPGSPPALEPAPEPVPVAGAATTWKVAATCPLTAPVRVTVCVPTSSVAGSAMVNVTLPSPSAACWTGPG